MIIIARHSARRPQCGMAPATRTMPRAAWSPESSPGGSSRSRRRRCTTAKGCHPRGRGKARSGGRARRTLARALPASRRRPSGKPAKNVRAVAREERAPRQRRAQAHVQVHLHGPDLSVHRQVRHTVGFISPSRLSLDSPEQAKEATGPQCLSLPSLGVLPALSAPRRGRCGSRSARPGTRLPGLIASADAAVARDVGCVVFAAVAKA